MGRIRDTAASVYANDLVPGTPRKPSKSQIRGLFKTVEDTIVEAAGGLLAFATWAELDAFDVEGLSDGQAAKVYGPDAGTHEDPVSEDTVDNTGVYRLVGEDWERIADLEAEAAREAREAAEAAATTATDKAQEATGAVAGFPAQVEAAVAEVAATAAAQIGGVAVELVEAAGEAQRASIAVARGGDLYASTADGLSNGVITAISLVGGSGGTNGTFDLAFSGGAGSGAAGRFTVAGGAVTSITITAKGRGYISAPTISFAASSGLTGASATAVIGANNNVAEYFSTPGSDGAALTVHRVDAGPVATAIARLEAWASRAARFFFGRARLETSDRPWVEPHPVRMYSCTLSGGAVKNSNGTYTLPPGGKVTTPRLSWGIFDVASPRYAYVPLTDETTGAIQITAKRGGTIIQAGSTTQEPSPGVAKQVWTNNLVAPNNDMELEVANVHATATVTIYPIETYSSDASYFPQIIRFDDVTLVPETRPIIDWDNISPMLRWGMSDRGLWAFCERFITHAFDLLLGNDANAGGLYAPKQNPGNAVSGAPAGSIIGLRRGGRWNQTLATLLGTTTNGLAVRDWSDGRGGDDWPVLDGGIDATALTWTSEGSGTFSTVMTVPADYLLYLNYDFGTVVEIDRAKRAAGEDLGAERLLVPIKVNATLPGPVMLPDQSPAIAKVMARPGSSLIYKLTPTTVKVYLHTTDGLAPGASPAYDYRVSNQQCCLDFVQGNHRLASVSNIEIRQGAKGLGVFCGSSRTIVDGMVISHGWRHGFHLEAGEARNLLIHGAGTLTLDGSGDYEGTNGFNVYINSNADGHSWRVENMLILNDASPFYVHCSAGTYDRGTARYVWLCRDRDPTTGALVPGEAMGIDQTDVTTEEWWHTRGYREEGRVGSTPIPIASTSRNHLIRQCGRVLSRLLREDFIANTQNISDPANVGNRGQRGITLRQNHVVRNGIIHMTNVAAATADYSAEGIRIETNVTGHTNANPQLKKMIIIYDNHLGTSQTILSETAAGLTYGLDQIIHVFCTPGHIASFKWGGSTKQTFADFLSAFAGVATNQYAFDLRDDPRRARAIFRDPYNGDFTWAQTAVAKRLKALADANDIGCRWTIQKWPFVPGIDEARKQMIASR